MDRLGAFLREPTPRRFICIGLFVGLLWVFRHLLVLLVFFVAFERVFAVASDFLATHGRVGRKPVLLALVLALLGGVGAAIALLVGHGIHFVLRMRETLPQRIAAVRETPLFQSIQERLGDADAMVEKAQHYASGALGYVAAFGHGLVYAVVGFILAVVFILEREELHHFYASVDPRSLAGTLLRWFNHVAEAMVVMLQFQLVVAACNAVLTLPILFLVGIPHKPLLVVLIFISGLVPVVGNFLVGALLTYLAYESRGWIGLGLFVALTFILHKLEAYYLNPRLAARHVRLPGFVLIVSLVLWEHMAGFVGLFLSFPFLFVAGRIRDELREEEEGGTGNHGSAERLGV
jgi:predicted PurR-regulated permease PerM